MMTVYYLVSVWWQHWRTRRMLSTEHRTRSTTARCRSHDSFGNWGESRCGLELLKLRMPRPSDSTAVAPVVGTDLLLTNLLAKFKYIHRRS